MAIRVIIERRILPGNELKLNELLIQLRSRAMGAKGYISGETLRSLDDPATYIVLSTWDTLDDWQAWAATEERKEIQEKIDRLLAAPSIHRVYVYD